MSEATPRRPRWSYIVPGTAPPLSSHQWSVLGLVLLAEISAQFSSSHLVLALSQIQQGLAIPEARLDEVNAQVQSVMLSLSNDYRSVIVLKYFLGCSYQQIAEALDIPVKKVRSRLFSARQQMKTGLDRASVLSP